MSGVRGPVPKRSDQRRRRNKPAVPITKGRGADRVEVPEADPDWHPIARRWFESLAISGQSRWYEPSDYATAWIAAESMSREFMPQPLVIGRGEDAHVVMVPLPPKGAALAAWLKAGTALLATEGDRRRMRLELNRGEEGPEDVTSLDRYRRQLRALEVDGA